jgi:glycosyltransferase involved in cell wall biosynthesis
LIAGSVKTHLERTKKILPQNVIVFGRVEQDKLLEIMRASDIAINPVATGSVICIKSLDYMAAGIPIVSTPVGMRGIPAKDKVHAMICGLESFDSSIRRLMKDGLLRKSMSANSRRLVEKEFDVNVVSRRLGAIIEKTLGLR